MLTNGGAAFLNGLFFKVLIEHLGHVVPVFDSVLLNDPDEFIIFFLYPVKLFDLVLFFLVKSVKTLRIVSTWNKAGYLFPVAFSEISWLDLFADTVFVYSPN
jgi:hypothetical protein